MSKQIPEVTALHLCADNDTNGNPRRCFVVLDSQGRHVETIDEEYRGEAALYSRWPMFHWRALGEFAGVDGASDPAEQARVESKQRYAVRVNVKPAEYKRWMQREPYEQTAKLRKWADRAEAVSTF